MINPKQLRDLVLIPTLDILELNSPAAVELLMGTAMQESDGLSALHQYGSGPAIGLLEMEPATHDDIWKNWLVYQPKLATRIKGLMIELVDDRKEMAGNLYYSFAMARCLYRRVSEPLPHSGDEMGMAHYWKRYYNTFQGAGTVVEYIANWNKLKVHL